MSVIEIEETFEISVEVGSGDGFSSGEAPAYDSGSGSGGSAVIGFPL